jgi:2-oxoisovalerate dehydrogenase E1 component
MDFKQFDNYSRNTKLNLYKSLLKPRLIEEKMLKLLRQGLITKWFSGIGQEAVAVGVTEALRDTDYILPVHRNLGVFTSRGIATEKLLKQWLGHQQGFTKGRDRSFHFGSKEHRIVGMISHLAAMLSVADGIALANRLDKNKEIVVAFCGDGATSEGEFHEALNLAAVWDLPVLFIIEHNGYGLSTPTAEQCRCKNFADKGVGYGIESKTIDGNNILEVYDTVKQVARSIRRTSSPFLLECKTFRMRGHEEASGTKYVPQELLKKWEDKDPLVQYESYLLRKKVLTTYKKDKYNRMYTNAINQTVGHIKTLSSTIADSDNEVNEVYKAHHFEAVQPGNNKREMRFIDAISNGLELALEKHKELVFMGQDIAEYGGVFKITEGFVDRFGKDRIRNTPISEAAPLGAALGLSIKGKKAMVEMQFADFVSCGFNQIVNNLAKTYYRWGQHSDVVIRMPTGGATGAGPFHSQNTEAWFFHEPGLKVVYPSTPSEAKGLLLASFEDPNPILFYEHKALYRSTQEQVPTDYYTLPIGKARILKEGEEITLITYGLGVEWCRTIVENENLDAKLVDLRTLKPWDKETVEKAVKSTGKALVVHEDHLTGGIGAEIAAWIGEHCFTYLDAPVMRVGGLDTPIPFNKDLEKNHLALSRLRNKIDELLEW